MAALRRVPELPSLLRAGPTPPTMLWLMAPLHQARQHLPRTAVGSLAAAPTCKMHAIVRPRAPNTARDGVMTVS
jgi:hypothetical protein